MGATENGRFSAKVQSNLALDFVAKQHKSLQKNSASLQLGVSDMLTRVNFPTFAMADPRCMTRPLWLLPRSRLRIVGGISV